MLTVLLLSFAAFQAAGIGSGPAPDPAPLANGAGPYPARGITTAPVPISKPEPGYTDDARDAGVKGEVRLRVTVDEKGVPSTITVVKPLFPSLDKSAMDTVAKWRFKPGMKDGKPTAVQVLIDVSFSPL